MPAMVPASLLGGAMDAHRFRGCMRLLALSLATVVMPYAPAFAGPYAAPQASRGPQTGARLQLSPRMVLPAHGGTPGTLIQCVRWPCPGDPLDSPTGHVVRALYRQFPRFHADPEPARALLSDGLLALLRKDAACAAGNGRCAIEADPWTAARDGDPAGPLHYRRLGVEKDAEGHDVAARVELCYRSTLGESPEPHCVVLSLTRGPRTAWQLDDLVSPDGQSLRGALQAYHYPR
ncbi:hypothetical protein [Stenotrophomonas mori]|uniref:DUF3828 domain-containing protein n=1 Tax=Stenotrophomonas mori TaxID=2871096 RepID=A0ABT0SDF5_9GAMM|nr:hypothetical protein [Stenotrophomonas mori]MCL7713341.1 hypothetical protein [Stenotrophomonas mori]